MCSLFAFPLSCLLLVVVFAMFLLLCVLNSFRVRCFFAYRFMFVFLSVWLQEHATREEHETSKETTQAGRVKDTTCCTMWATQSNTSIAKTKTNKTKLKQNTNT